MHKREPKFNIPMFAALVLLLLTMVSMHLTSGLYARYTASSFGEDSARVAKFDVSTQLTADADTNGLYQLTVTNGSEVTVQYKVTVTFTGPLDAAITNLPEDSITEPTVKDTKTGVITFTNAEWVLSPNGTARSHALQIDVSHWDGITSSEHTGETETLNYDFNVAVTAEQVD